MNAAEQRLNVLLDPILDTTASDAQRREFFELVDDHPELVPPLVEQLRTHSLLQWHCEEIRIEQIPVLETIRSAANRRNWSANSVLPVWIASIAALLLIATSAIFWGRSSSSGLPQDVIAEIVEEKGVAWSEKTTALGSAKSIHAGRLETESGSLTLRFRSGATVVFRGPASMQVDSDMLVRLDRGHATAQVPHWAKGFTIKTADVEVIDLGTQFGVMARSDGVTDVVIFEGQVDVKPTGGDGSMQRRLDQGEAARFDSNGGIKRIVDVRGDTKGEWSTVNHSESSRSVFRSIRDNIPPSDGSRYYYYQTTAKGLEDDALAYVDRHPHQWNGLTAKGLPKFLLGADYVRTFNDYRYIRGFGIVVEMAQAADLYVFFDDRVPIPGWLPEGFEKTEVKIGLDEGPWEGIENHRTAVGGGKSIDNTFSIWRRRCRAGEAVTLGAVGDSNEARAMYGIAATPIQERAADAILGDKLPANP